MKIDLSELIHHPGMHAVQEIEQPCPKDIDFECFKPVKGKLEFTNTGTLLIIMGELAGEVKLECSRCLTDFALPVETTVEEEFNIEKVGDSLRALPLEEEDVDTGLIVNNILDVDELIRQNLLLVLPIKPLCTEECAGLCTTCGENLNVRECSCPPADMDSPFGVLAELLEEEENNDS